MLMVSKFVLLTIGHRGLRFILTGGFAPFLTTILSSRVPDGSSRISEARLFVSKVETSASGEMDDADRIPKDLVDL